MIQHQFVFFRHTGRQLANFGSTIRTVIILLILPFTFGVGRCVLRNRVLPSLLRPIWSCTLYTQIEHKHLLMADTRSTVTDLDYDLSEVQMIYCRSCSVRGVADLDHDLSEVQMV